MLKAEKAVGRRLGYVEFRKFREGHVNRADLIGAFEVSVDQASSDMNRYIGMAPDNMVYDNSAQTYIRCSAFDPLFLKPDASRHLSQLRSIADGILDQTEAFGQFPSYNAAPTPVRNVDAKTLRSVLPRSGGSRQSGQVPIALAAADRARRANAGSELRVDNGRLKDD